MKEIIDNENKTLYSPKSTIIGLLTKNDKELQKKLELDEKSISKFSFTSRSFLKAS